MRTNLDTLTLLTSIASRGLAVLYGLLSLLHFNKVENLNIWIISGYVATVATLANIIVQPTPFLDVDKMHIGIGGKKFNKRVFLGVVSAFAVQALPGLMHTVVPGLHGQFSGVLISPGKSGPSNETSRVWGRVGSWCEAAGSTCLQSAAAPICLG